jgi:hypothetical protein
VKTVVEWGEKAQGAPLTLGLQNKGERGGYPEGKSPWGFLYIGGVGIEMKMERRAKVYAHK